MIETVNESIAVKQYTLTGDVANADIDYGVNDDYEHKGPIPNKSKPIKAGIPGKVNGMNNAGAPPPVPHKAMNGNNAPPPVPNKAMNGNGNAPPPFNISSNERKEDNGPGVPPPFKPPVFNPSGNAAPPPNPMSSNNGAPPPNPYSESGNAPPPNPYAMESVAPKVLSPMERAMMSAKIAEQSGMNKQRQAPKPAMVGMKSRGLLDSIKSGKKLRKAKPIVKRKEPMDKRSMLMSQLRTGAKLKKTVSQKPAAKAKKPENEGIFAILNRRQYIADDDSDSDDDSGSWEDDY